MAEHYTREILRRNVAQICQTIGWNGIQSTPLDILVHVLEKYIRTLGTQTSRYAEEFNRTEPNLHDLGLVFSDLHVHLPELVDYVRSVPPAPCPVAVEQFPQPKESHLNFLKPGSREVVTRPIHVNEHLPPMYPEKEQTPPIADSVEIHQNGLEPIEGGSTSPEISVTDSPEKKDPFKRPIDPVSLPPSKRPRLKLEEEECHTRELSSVMMTMSGLLSPAREGKLPEARVPTVMSERHEKHKNSHHSNLMRVPGLQVSAERSDKKSKKSRLVNGKIMKNKKKDKDRHRSDSSKSKDKLDRTVQGVPVPNRSKDVMHLNNVTMPAPRPVLPVPPVPPPAPLTPLLDNRPIKQEPLDIPPSPLNRHVLVPESAIPVPRRIPIAKSPLVPSMASTAIPKSSTTNIIVPPPIEIKQEVIDEEEKLESQPDRSKINIFKRISNKGKEDKTPSESNERPESSTSRLDNVSSVDKNSIPENFKLKKEHVNNNSDSSAADLSKALDLTTNEIINIDDDSMEMNATPKIKEEPVRLPVINPVAINKLQQSPYPRDGPYPKDVGGIPKPKKERKHKEKIDKATEKVAKINAKLIKKQQKALQQAMAAQVQVNRPFPPSPHIQHKSSVQQKTPKVNRPRKNEPKIPQMPPGFPFFPSLGHGILPGPGLIPKPLIPGNDLYAGLVNNPALRGLHPPNMLANPFALGGRGLIPCGGMMQGPGLFPPGLFNSVRPPNRPQPQPAFPMRRRPSLEVIPIDCNDDRIPQSLQISPIREKVKNDKHKISSIPNILQKHNKNKVPKDSPPKINTYKMPTVTPDITIELNPPTVKAEPVKPSVSMSEVPSLPIPVPVPVLVPKPKPSIPQPVPETSSTESPIDKDKGEKKKDKVHKKEKKEKDGLKIKKKKDKKEKSKDKSEKRKDKDEKVEGKDKIKKEKKEKRKDKEKEKAPTPVDGLVPKLTLKLGSSSPMPPSSPDIFKLNIKPVVKKDPETPIVEPKEEPTSRENSRSPELAQISALVTRPPKPKPKHNHVSPDQSVEVKPGSPPPQTSNSSPSRKNRPPSSHSKYKRIQIKPLAKRGHVDDELPTESIPEDPPPRSNVDKSVPMQLSTPYYIDEIGNKVWVCPACGRPDNGTPMIGCDGCDGWYHWVCVGITVDPGVSEDWFCKSCMAKRAAMVTALAGVQTGRKRGRKPKVEKVKEGQ